MSTRITIDSEQVLGIATQIESDNQQLQQLLEDSKATLNNLASTWTGGAAEQTRSSYETFAGKYFQTYFDVLEQYVKFLRTNVAEQYTEVENLNTQLGDAFK
jgi:WXG100 family type VII secretion target